MAASDAFRIKAAQDVGAQGGLISLHSAAVDCSSTANANATEVSGGGYTRKTTAWGTPVAGSGGDAGKAVMTGSTQQFDVEAGDTVSHFCVRKADGTPLWSDILVPGLTLNAAGNGKVDVVAVYKYSHQ